MRLRAILVRVPVADRTHVLHHRGEVLEHPGASGDGRVGAADHHRERALAGTARAAADRRVHQVHPRGRRQLRERHRCLGADRRVHGHDRAGSRGREDPVGTLEDLADLRLVLHHDADDGAPATRPRHRWRRRSPRGEVNFSIAAGNTSCTTSPPGHVASRLAIGEPMLPRPMKPTDGRAVHSSSPSIDTPSTSLMSAPSGHRRR